MKIVNTDQPTVDWLTGVEKKNDVSVTTIGEQSSVIDRLVCPWSPFILVGVGIHPTDPCCYTLSNGNSFEWAHTGVNKPGPSLLTRTTFNWRLLVFASDRIDTISTNGSSVLLWQFWPIGFIQDGRFNDKDWPVKRDPSPNSALETWDKYTEQLEWAH